MQGERTDHKIENFVFGEKKKMVTTAHVKNCVAMVLYVPSLRGQVCSNQYLFLVLGGGELLFLRLGDGDNDDVPHLVL